jgi:hypothetical protein
MTFGLPVSAWIHTNEEKKQMLERVQNRAHSTSYAEAVPAKHHAGVKLQQLLLSYLVFFKNWPSALSTLTPAHASTPRGQPSNFQIYFLANRC